MERQSLWRQIIAAKCRVHPMGWFTLKPAITYGTSVFRGILNVQDSFKNGVVYKGWHHFFLAVWRGALEIGLSLSL